jgi:hypothetical protein
MKFNEGDLIIYIEKNDSFFNSIHKIVKICEHHLKVICITSPHPNTEHRIGQEWNLHPIEVRKLSPLELALL